MAVWKVKPRKVLAFSIPTIERDLLATQFVTRVSGDQFKGSLGDTVDLKVGGLRARTRDYEWRTRAAEVVFDDIFGGGKFQVKLNKHVTSATALTDEHATMDDIDFALDVTQPMAEAFARDYEAKVLAALAAANVKYKFTTDGNRFANEADPLHVALELSRLMNQAKRVPKTGRVYLIGSDIAAHWKASDRLSKHEWIGSEASETVRQGVIGDLNGTPVVEHNELDPKQGYYLHKSSLVLASIAPDLPRGASAAGKLSNKVGQGLRLVLGYNHRKLTDEAVMSTFLGINEFRDETTPSGEWIFETGEVDADELAQMYPSGSVPTLQPVGTRKNVRIIPFQYETGGTVLTDGDLAPDPTP